MLRYIRERQRDRDIYDMSHIYETHIYTHIRNIYMCVTCIYLYDIY